MPLKKTVKKKPPSPRIVFRDISSLLAEFPNEALPRLLSPQLATRVDSVPSDGLWLHEVKYDGYRILARKSGSSVRLFTRNGKDWTKKLPDLAQELAALGDFKAWLDGELTVLEEDGRTSFQGLQNMLEGGEQHVCFFLFDLLHLDGKNLRAAPLVTRKKLLERLLRGSKSEHIRYSAHTDGDGTAIYEEACRRKWEGIICKKADSSYQSARTRTWLKVKCDERQEFVIGGFKKYKGSLAQVGALLLGVYGKDKTLQYAGKVGTGFDGKSRTALYRLLSKAAAKKPAFSNPPKERDCIWVSPTQVAEIVFREWTSDGAVRHGVFQGLREDKNPLSVRRELPQPAKKRAPTKASRNPSSGPRSGTKKGKD